MSNLKPCPFCDGEVELKTKRGDMNGPSQLYILCTGCALTFRGFLLDKHCWHHADDPEYIQDVHDFWNDRP